MISRGCAHAGPGVATPLYGSNILPIMLALYAQCFQAPIMLIIMPTYSAGPY